MTKLGVIVGSIRQNSFSEQVAKNVSGMFPEGYDIEFIEIGHLPYYNQDDDVEGQVPEAYQTFREQIKDQDAFLFVTPEFNRSIPAPLKNALDLASRPREENAWDGKPAAIISQSPGLLGGFGVNHHLRQVLSALNTPLLQQPEVYLSQVHQLLDEDGKINNEQTRAFLQGFVDAFIKLIEQNKQ